MCKYNFQFLLKNIYKFFLIYVRYNWFSLVMRDVGKIAVFESLSITSCHRPHSGTAKPCLYWSLNPTERHSVSTFLMVSFIDFQFPDIHMSYFFAFYLDNDPADFLQLSTKLIHDRKKISTFFPTFSDFFSDFFINKLFSSGDIRTFFNNNISFIFIENIFRIVLDNK